jgi:hypothetical protein
VLSILPGTLLSQDRRSQPQCSVATVSVSLNTGDTYSQQLSGDLKFEMKPFSPSGGGWMLSLTDGKGRDFFCPVNPAMRACEPEQLGAGYGESTKQALSHSRELRFLLNESDYDRLEPYVRSVFSPSNPAEGARAADDYLEQSDQLRTGLLLITIIRADVSEGDEVRSADFKLEFFVPASFRSAPTLSLKGAGCPDATLPIDERLVLRIAPANPPAYRKIQDAADWRNPYLMITIDGFDLRFQGGRLHGPLSFLRRTLVGLPNSAWPYGRVVAGGESGVQAPGTAEILNKNKEDADKILRELGVAVEWWPSA